MWMLTKGSPQQRRILVIKWIWWPILVHTVPLPQPLLWLPSGHMNNSHYSRGEDYMWAQWHGIALTKAGMTVATAECNLPGADTTLSSQYDTIPQDDQPAIWWQIDYPGLLPSWKGRSFILSATDNLDIDFLYCCQNYYPWIYRTPYSSPCYST